MANCNNFRTLFFVEPNHSNTFMKLLTVLFITLSTYSFGQNCTIESKKDWERVEVRILEQKEAPDGAQYTGEWIVDGLFAKSITDVSKRQLKKIKQQVAKDKACVVYLDFKGLMGSTRGLYYVWTDESGAVD